MQPPNLSLFERIRRTAGRLAADIIVSSMATLIATMILSGVVKRPMVPALALSKATQPVSPTALGENSDDALAAFMERVALSHMSPKALAGVEDRANTIAAAPPPVAVSAPPPRQGPALKHERIAAKVQPASTKAASAPPPMPPENGTPEPSAAAPAAPEPLPPLQYGIRLVTDMKTRVAESVVSVGDTLSHFVGKL
ncbi:MAG TPA: hypothetical protein VEK34_02660 [Methylocella sp.]|nr:hypothetical protein [Methylocella sp.]